MTEARRSDSGVLPLAATRRVDRACNQFEDAWRSGRPRNEQFLGDGPERSGLRYFN